MNVKEMSNYQIVTYLREYHDLCKHEQAIQIAERESIYNEAKKRGLINEDNKK